MKNTTIFKRLLGLFKSVQTSVIFCTAFSSYQHCLYGSCSVSCRKGDDDVVCKYCR